MLLHSRAVASVHTIASIVTFNILAMSVPVYAYYVYVMIYRLVSFVSCPILVKVLTLNVTICIVSLHFSNFCLILSSVANFSNTGLQPQQDVRLFLTVRRAMWFG